MKNGCLFVVLAFICLFLMCSVKCRMLSKPNIPPVIVPLPEPKPIPIIKVKPKIDHDINTPSNTNTNIDELKPNIQPIDSNNAEPLPEPVKIPIKKEILPDQKQTIQYGHWETRTTRSGFLGLRNRKYKVWVNDGTTTRSTISGCKDGTCQ